MEQDSLNLRDWDMLGGNNSFISLLEFDFYKLSKNLTIRLLLSIFIVLIVVAFSYVLFMYSDLTVGKTIEYYSNPYIYFLRIYMKILQYSLPILIALIVSTTHYSDKEHNGFYIVQGLPYSCFAKDLINYLSMVWGLFLSFIMAYMVFLICVLLSSILMPLMPFKSYNIEVSLFFCFLNIFLLAIGILTIQYGIICLTDNSIVSIFIAFLLMVFSTPLTLYSPNGYIKDIMYRIILNDNRVDLLPVIQIVGCLAVLGLLYYGKIYVSKHGNITTSRRKNT